MLKSKKPPPVIHPPLPLRERALERYYNNLTMIDYIDALIAYEIDMHKLYVRFNPRFAKNKFGKPWRPKTRKDFGPKEDFNQ